PSSRCWARAPEIGSTPGDDRAAERLQDSSERRSPSDDPPPARLHDSVGAVRRDRRALGQWQVDAARPAGRARCPNYRADPDRWRRYHDVDRGWPGPPAWREDRIRFSVLSPGAIADRVRERPDSDGDRGP